MLFFFQVKPLFIQKLQISFTDYQEYSNVCYVRSGTLGKNIRRGEKKRKKKIKKGRKSKSLNTYRESLRNKNHESGSENNPSGN